MIQNKISFQSELTFRGKILSLNWGFILLITLTACIGFAALYSAAGGNFDPWASRQINRFIIGFFLMLGIALTPTKFWYHTTWLIYLGGLGLLLIVKFFGETGKGAQRWIDLGFMQLQPSELIKIAVVMALARYYHTVPVEDQKRLGILVIPIFLILIPVGFVYLQPDLGTSLMITMCGIGIIFLAGASIWLFVIGGAGALASIPILWKLMHPYQKKRVMTFLNPESDPLGAGYHITQSKIALGSGGMHGKGFLEGTQSKLNFLPEKQTDFIFTLWAEEWGFMGGLTLLLLFAVIFCYGLWISVRVKNNFGRIMSMGLMINFSLYVFVNTAMVMGLIPVVGAPLPLISYGGTSMLAILISCGLIMSAYVHREQKLV